MAGDNQGAGRERASQSRLLLRIGSIGPLGHMPASGTVTVAVVGLPGFWLLAHWPWWARLLFAVVFAAASIRLHEIGDALLGEKDSRKLVWDELAGFWVAVVFAPEFTWPLAVIAFLAERIIDIAKVPPGNWIEQRWPGGWGVVGDDLIAGAYTCGLLAVLIRFVPNWVGLPP